MLYTIEDTTLNGLADAIRNKPGYKYIGGFEEPNEEPFYTITVDTSTIEDWDTNDNYYFDIDFTEAVGDRYYLAKYIYCTLEYEIDDISAFNVYIRNFSAGTYKTYYLLQSGKYTENNDIKYNNGTFTGIINRRKDNINGIFTIKMWACDENKDFLGINKYTPLDMIDKINGFNVLPDEGLTITGNCDYRFCNNGWNWFINGFGDKVTTKDITASIYNSMFKDTSSLKSIPFDLNFSPSYNSSGKEMFSNCQSLTDIPKITNMKIKDSEKMFYNCTKLRYFPEGFSEGFIYTTLDATTSAYSANQSSTFDCCYSLRQLPMDFLKHGNPYSNYSYCIYYYGFNKCHVLDEIIDLPIPYSKVTWSSNAFVSAFNNCYRLKEMTFAPIDFQVKWKSQVIDLSYNIGHATTNSSNKEMITKYNSGITKDKEVKDDATYQALKNDPDYWTGLLEYSRYNRASAARTLASLPDTSAYGTNTIKFKGASGSLTDEGAINTLTEEEIAVAASKGWTVSLS
jgi:hypothetical protein